MQLFIAKRLKLNIDEPYALAKLNSTTADSPTDNLFIASVILEWDSFASSATI